MVITIKDVLDGEMARLTSKLNNIDSRRTHLARLREDISRFDNVASMKVYSRHFEFSVYTDSIDDVVGAFYDNNLVGSYDVKDADESADEDFIVVIRTNIDTQAATQSAYYSFRREETDVGN